MPDRQAAFQFLVDLLVEHSTGMHYCYVAREQHAALLAEAQEQTSVRLPKKQKVGLSRVFFGRLVEQVRRDQRAVTVVADSDKPLRNKIKVLSLHDTPIVYACSKAIEGLQLADCAAYVLNRVFHSKVREEQDNLGPFDELVLNAYARLRPTLNDLLAP